MEDKKEYKRVLDGMMEMFLNRELKPEALMAMLEFMAALLATVSEDDEAAEQGAVLAGKTLVSMTTSHRKKLSKLNTENLMKMFRL